MKAQTVGYLRLLKRIVLFSLISLIFSESTFAKNQQHQLNRPLDLVFCLDLSGSTNGLINDVRDNIWSIINQTNSMSPKPDLRIAVVGFSRPSFGKNNGYVKVLCDLTHDFDHLAAELYRLKPCIEKGDQFVDHALASCISDLTWTKNTAALKIVFVVGNGTVTSNGYDYVQTCEVAKSKGIVVNTLYVMKSPNFFKELPAYRRIANITGGMESEIIVNKPDDVPLLDGNYDEVVKQNKILNNSYHWIGADSMYCRKEQFTSDSGAFYASKNTYFNRIYYKLSDEYSNVIHPVELVELNTTGEIKTVMDSATAYSPEFQFKLQEWKDERDHATDLLKKQFPSSLFINFGTLYKNNKLPDNSSFRRSVLNILYKQW